MAAETTETQHREAPPAHGRRYATPTASYRVQLHRGFTFDDARALVPYLAKLGFSHLYCSPFFTATPGSTHGYDVTDHGQINPELGGLPGLRALGEALIAHDLGLIVDMVPNHVGLANGANPWWRDVLRHGEDSRHASAFDINWRNQPHLPSGVLVYPILGHPFGQALEAGELRLELIDDDLALRYFEHRLPLAPRSYAEVVGPLWAGDGSPDPGQGYRDPTTAVELADLLDRLRAAPPDEADRLLDRFRRIVGDEPLLAERLRARLSVLNGTVGDAASFDALDAILAGQHYRLVYWRGAGEEINYRRFFDINELAGVRVEREDIFAAIHRLLFSLVTQGIVTGVRIDHVDGLYDPAQYLERLRDGLREAARGVTERPILIYVEKILDLDEALPVTWPVAGTTGYDFLAHCDGLLIDRGSVLEMTRTYERFIGEPVRFRQLRYAAKRQIARTAFIGEISVLAVQLHAIAQRDRRRRDNTLGALRRAIESALAAFPVYRTYVAGGEGMSGDRATIEAALAEARRQDRTLTAEALDFLREVLLLEYGEAGPRLAPEEYERRLHFRRRFQQLSSPVMAKGFEDTTFYRYNRLVSLNEVGNDPSQFGVAPAAAQAWFAARARDWPAAMSASTTHDTKRSEDARARLHVIAELPKLWAAEVRRWSNLNAQHRATIQGEPVPDATTEYLLYQNLVASWPDDGAIDDTYRERLAGYLTKAMREMKSFTSWTDTDETVEAAAQEFLTALLHPRRGRAFRKRLTRFVARLEPSTTLNALSALIVKATAPGFPDFYQGTELWDRSLTDPDNRRPVDFATRRALLDTLAEAPPPDLRDPAAKLWLAHRLLALRARHANLFACGDYQPVVTSGGGAAHLFAFSREHRASQLIVAVPRLTTRLVGPGGAPPLGAAWGDTALAVPGGRGTWRDLLTGAAQLAADGQLACSALFATLPFALLLREHDGHTNEREKEGADE